MLGFPNAIAFGTPCTCVFSVPCSNVRVRDSWKFEVHFDKRKKSDLSTWNLFVLYFGGWTLQNKIFSNQNNCHLVPGSIWWSLVVNFFRQHQNTVNSSTPKRRVLVHPNKRMPLKMTKLLVNMSNYDVFTRCSNTNMNQTSVPQQAN